MTSDRLISIVLPTYNGASHIERSIRSCLGQTYTHWELVIVDDASTDNTANILNSFVSLDDRIHCITHERNRKLPAALNTGFSQTRGDYLTWTSDDNYYRPEALATMLDFLENSPEIDMVYTDFTIVDNKGRVVKHEKAQPFRELLKGNCVGASFLYRRHVMEVIGTYSEDLLLAEDYEYWLRVSTHFNMMPLSKDLYCYRKHEQSLTSLGLRRRHRVAVNALSRNLPLISWATSYEKSEAYILYARLALTHRDFVAMQNYLLKALFHSPVCFVRHFLKVARWRSASVLGKPSPDYKAKRLGDGNI